MGEKRGNTGFGGENWGEKLFGRPRSRREDNIKIGSVMRGHGPDRCASG